MKIVNIVQLQSGIISKINSFVIFEEQLSEDVYKEVEKTFKNLIELNLKKEIDDEDLDDYITKGYQNNNYEVCIIFSESVNE